MLKHLGLAAVGVAAGLMTCAPMASAHEREADHHAGDRSCSSAGSDASETATVDEDRPGNVVAQAPLGGDVVGRTACSDVLSNNHDNLSDNVDDHDDISV